MASVASNHLSPSFLPNAYLMKGNNTRTHHSARRSMHGGISCTCIEMPVTIQMQSVLDCRDDEECNYSPKSFCTRFNIESLLGSVGGLQQQSGGKRKDVHTVWVILGGYLEEGRERGLVLVDHRTDLLSNL